MNIIEQLERTIADLQGQYNAALARRDYVESEQLINLIRATRRYKEAWEVKLNVSK